MLPWMIQRCDRLRDGIHSFSGCVFSVVASLAGESEIFQSIRTFFGEWDDVFDCKRVWGILLLRETVLATTFCAFQNAGALRR